MPPTYIAGYDGSDASSAAVALAQALAKAASADMLVATVYLRTPPAYAPGASAMADAELDQEARADAERLLDVLEVAGVRKRTIRADSAPRGLHELAVLEEAALLAVGATHRGPFGRLAPGSVAERLLHGAPCPVLVTPSGRGAANLETVAVAVDGRPEADAALREAAEHAQRIGARLRLLAVVEPPGLSAPPPMVGVDLGSAVREELERRLERAANALRPGLEVETRLLDGHAGKALAKASDDVDLLVCGSRGYGPIRSVLLGSVSRYLVDSAACPVLVVPRAAEPDDDHTSPPVIAARF